MKDEFLTTLLIERKENGKGKCEFIKVEEMKRINPSIAQEVNAKYCSVKKKSLILTSVELFDEAITNKRLKEEVQMKKKGVVDEIIKY